MPLPRYERLDAASRAAILDAARALFARDGREETTLQRVADAAMISRSAVYNYFDGKDDLFETVHADSLAQLRTALGDWKFAADEQSLWAQFADAQGRLLGLLAEQPNHRLIVQMGVQSEGADGAWVERFFANAVELGLVDLAPGRALLLQASAAVIAAADAVELAAQGSIRPAALVELLRRLWRGSLA